MTRDRLALAGYVDTRWLLLGAWAKKGHTPLVSRREGDAASTWHTHVRGVRGADGGSHVPLREVHLRSPRHRRTKTTTKRLLQSNFMNVSL